MRVAIAASVTAEALGHLAVREALGHQEQQLAIAGSRPSRREPVPARPRHPRPSRSPASAARREPDRTLEPAHAHVLVHRALHDPRERDLEVRAHEGLRLGWSGREDDLARRHDDVRIDVLVVGLRERLHRGERRGDRGRPCRRALGRPGRVPRRTRAPTADGPRAAPRAAWLPRRTARRARAARRRRRRCPSLRSLDRQSRERLAARGRPALRRRDLERPFEVGAHPGGVAGRRPGHAAPQRELAGPRGGRRSAGDLGRRRDPALRRRRRRRAGGA